MNNYQNDFPSQESNRATYLLTFFPFEKTVMKQMSTEISCFLQCIFLRTEFALKNLNHMLQMLSHLHGTSSTLFVV